MAEFYTKTKWDDLTIAQQYAVYNGVAEELVALRDDMEFLDEKRDDPEFVVATRCSVCDLSSVEWPSYEADHVMLRCFQLGHTITLSR